MKFCAEVAEVLKSVPDAVEVDAYIKKVAGDIDISPEAIYSKYRQKKSFENGPKSKKTTYESSKQLVDEFKARCGALNCCDLKAGKRVSCDECIACAAGIVEEKLL